MAWVLTCLIIEKLFFRFGVKCSEMMLIQTFLFFQVVGSIKSYLDISADPPTFVQVTIPALRFSCKI
jgi:hypothetical protein